MRKADRLTIRVLAVMLFVLPAIFSMVSHLVLGDKIWSAPYFHASVEAAGAVIALILAFLLLAIRAHQHKSALFFMSCSLAGMGVLDAFHSFVGPGEVFVWLHSLATAVGGVLAVGVWLPLKLDHWRRARVALWFLLTAATAAGVVFVSAPSVIPVMIIDGSFSPVATAMNVGGGLFYLAAAIYFVLDYRKDNSRQALILGVLCLFLGLAGLLFKTSAIWDMDWWIWHLLRVIAFVFALAYITFIYKASLKEMEQKTELEELLATLQEQQAIISEQEQVSRGRIELNEITRSERDTQKLAEKALSYLASFLGAHVGAIYLKDSPETLVFAGGYAYKKHDDIAPSFRLGEGLLGEVAVAGEPMLWNDVPADYIKVSSSLLERQPGTILFYPLMLAGKVTGVIELGSIGDLGKKAIGFLDLVSEALAAAFDAAATSRSSKRP